MEQIELQDQDFLTVAKAQAAHDVAFALQVKCIALIRMLEEKQRQYDLLQSKYEELLPSGGK